MTQHQGVPICKVGRRGLPTLDRVVAPYIA